MFAAVHAEKRVGHHVPQEGVPRLSHGAEIQGMGQRQAQARRQRFPHRQADRLPSALGADIHRHAQRPAVRRETELGGKNGQDDTGIRILVIVLQARKNYIYIYIITQ